MTDSLEVRRNIGYLPDAVPLYNEMRVEEYLKLSGQAQGGSARKRTAPSASSIAWTAAGSREVAAPA